MATILWQYARRLLCGKATLQKGLRKNLSYKVIAGNDQRLLLTCEHASNRLPPPWIWPENDTLRGLPTMHWGYDLGSADFVEELCKQTNAPAILAQFTRLLIDPNRPLDSPTLFRDIADGKPVELNDRSRLTPAERSRRIKEFYEPYHGQLAELVAAASTHLRLMVAIHSFTPEYEGQKREMEVGVLYHDDADDALATTVNEALKRHGYKSVINAPWSGKEGFMYTVNKYAQPNPPARTRRIPNLMFEMRQDLLTQPKWRSKFALVLVDCLKPVYGV